MTELVYHGDPTTVATDPGQGSSQGQQVQKQKHEHGLARMRCLAWTALVLTTLLLLAPGALIDAALAAVEPVTEALGRLMSRWWPWQATDSTESSLAVDKVIHFLLFTACAVLVTKAWRETLNIVTILLLLLAFAVLTEVAQYFIPGRGMSLADIVADSIGAVIGIGFGLGYLLPRSAAKVN